MPDAVTKESADIGELMILLGGVFYGFSDAQLIDGVADQDQTIDLTSTGETTVYRFREGIERFLITDINNPAASAKAQSSIATMYDYISSDMSGGFEFPHVPGGGNVLYLDGHVQFIRYPGEWPICYNMAVLVGL
jgi:prepilin-type processing-associated H-X9-DG protein